jgi:hypothetical protein
MFGSPENPYLLPHYDEAMACALATSMLTFLPRPRIFGDPKILYFIDMSATKDYVITLSSSYSKDEGSPDSYPSSFESNVYSREVPVD